MKKLLMLILVGGVISSCSKSGGDIYLGTWRNAALEDVTIVVTKHDGGKDYTIVRKVHYPAVAANKALYIKASPETNNIVETYTGVADGNTIKASDSIFSTPMEMQGEQLFANFLPNCNQEKCKLWNKVKEQQ